MPEFTFRIFHSKLWIPQSKNWNPQSIQSPNSGFQYLILDSTIPNSRFHYSDFAFQILESAFHFSNFEFSISNFVLWILHTKFWISHFEMNPEFGIRNEDSKNIEWGIRNVESKICIAESWIWKVECEIWRVEFGKRSPESLNHNLECAIRKFWNVIPEFGKCNLKCIIWIFQIFDPIFRILISLFTFPYYS